jgi:peptidoglycan hydrolase-like protein with peptidoglycan-binding domain
VIATNDFGAPGRETTTYWYSTQTALKRYQKDNSIPETGLFDQATREFLKLKFKKTP